ncbi:MAG: hypothetical protein V4787_00275 [Pseudomonadota bacterium]
MPAVQRRCVFYVSGFDPKGARHYHGLYRDQAALQARVNGLSIEVGARHRAAGGAPGNSAWTLEARDEGVDVRTHYEFMAWDEVVRKHWPRTTGRLWWIILATTWLNLRTGTMWRMFKLCWPPAVALFGPFVALMAAIIGIPAGAAAAGGLASRAGGSAPLAALAALAAGGALAWLFLKLESRYSMYWLMRSYAFTARQARGQVPELDEVLDAQAARLLQRLRDGGDDEVLVVGHSSGAIMAVSIVARALRTNPAVFTKPGRVVSLMTLGHCFPMLGLLPQATVFRRELQAVLASPRVDWIDFSAPVDSSCFSLVDPAACFGESPVERRSGQPKLLSPRFAEMFHAGEYQAMRPDKFRIHFQYLMASGRPTLYDFFAITAGAKTLAERFKAVESVAHYRALRPFG